MNVTYEKTNETMALYVKELANATGFSLRQDIALDVLKYHYTYTSHACMFA